jgi:hypothetical protein
VFIAMDHFTAECVGIHASSRATRFEAREPIRQSARRYFGAFAKDIACGLAVRHDHGRMRKIRARSVVELARMADMLGTSAESV